METQRSQFDSHRFVKRLTKAGLSEEVAEILADEHTRQVVPRDVATKADVVEVDAKIDALKAEMATKRDVAELDAKFDAKIDALKTELRKEIAACEARMQQRMEKAILEAKVSLIKWMITTMMVFSGIVIGAVTALQ